MLRRRKSKSNWLFFTICVVIFYKKLSQVMKRKNRKNFDDFFRNSFFGQKVSSKFWKCINAYFYIRWMIFVIKLHSTKFLFSLSMTFKDFVKSHPDLKGWEYDLFLIFVSDLFPNKTFKNRDVFFVLLNEIWFSKQ